MPVFNVIKSTDPEDYFEDTAWVPVTISNPNFDWEDSKMVSRDNFTDQRLWKGCKMYLSTARPFACFQLHLEVN
jgi:hypothetical protein